MTGAQDPSPFLPDPDLVGNAEGDRRALRRDRQAAQDAVDAHAAARGQAASIAAVMLLAQRYAEREGHVVWDDLVGEDVAAYVELARSDLEAVAPLMAPAEFGASSSAQVHPVTATAAEDRRILTVFDEYQRKVTAGRIKWYAFRDAVAPLMGDPAAAVIAELERWDVGLAKSIADGGAKMHAPLTVQESIEAIRESLRARIEQLGGQTEATP